MDTRGAIVRRRLAVLVTVAACASAAACGGPSEPVPPGAVASAQPLAQLDIDAQPQLLLGVDVGSGNPMFRQQGLDRVRTSVSALDRGKLGTAAAPGNELAIRFPTYTSATRYPRAVVVVRGSGNDFDPGSSDLEWGADVRVDYISSGGHVDNGDNILQRGLSSDPVLFKAELDGHHAGCTIGGSKGKLVLHSRQTLDPLVWYRLRCSRQGNKLTLTVFSLTASGTTRLFSRSARGPIGSLDFESPNIPVSVGGKVAHNGDLIKSATDQFNGELTRPVVAIGP